MKFRIFSALRASSSFSFASLSAAECHLQGKSSVLAAVKISVDEPEVDAPDEGLVEFSVDK